MIYEYVSEVLAAGLFLEMWSNRAGPGVCCQGLGQSRAGTREGVVIIL